MLFGIKILLILCGLGIVISLTLFIWISRRKFYRRNVSGLEEFKSYSSALFNIFGEGFLKLIAWVLLIASLLVGGLLSF